MSDRGQLDAIVVRAALARRALWSFVTVALTALVVRGVLIAPSTGIPDVHVPSALMLTVRMPSDPWFLRAETPHLIGRGIGLIPRVLSTLLSAGTLGAGVALIWALAVHRGGIVKLALVYLIVVSLIGPFPMLMQPETASAIEVDAAERLLGPVPIAKPADPVWKRYMFAQMAYARGDRANARRLSADLAARDIGGLHETTYRLQLMQGKSADISNVCFMRGCLSAAVLERARGASADIGILALLCSAVAGGLLVILRARLARVDALLARARVAARLA
jgi:hypothetical protein